MDAFEIILHRVLWSFIFFVPLLFLSHQWSALRGVVRSPKTLSTLLATAILVGGNWLLYIWAVNNGRVLQASLGYYINPLVNIFLGMLFLRERLRKAQSIAVILAVLGVLFYTFRLGVFPWVSLALALSFGFYGLIRKTASIPPLVGLAVETFLLTLPAGIWVWHLYRTHTGVFLQCGLHTDLLLMGTGVLTATPLLLFNLGAKRITMASLGFIQYTSPTGMLVLGITIFGESFTHVQTITFGLIWLALAIYSWDMVIFHKKSR